MRKMSIAALLAQEVPGTPASTHFRMLPKTLAQFFRIGYSTFMLRTAANIQIDFPPQATDNHGGQAPNSLKHHFFIKSLLKNAPGFFQNRILSQKNRPFPAKSILYSLENTPFSFGDYVVKPPFVLGHEPGGTVVEVGSAVKHLKPGDKVALEPGKTCGCCAFCREGKYNLCPDVIFFATPPVDGVFQEYAAHEADLCFKIADNMDTLEAALIEPLAVGFHAANQGNAHAGQTAVVFGSGCIGLVSTMALKAMGLSKIYQVDLMPKRLEKAIELGAAGIINIKEQDPVEAIKELTAGRGCDLVIETSGVESAARQAVSIARKGANIVMVGYGKTGMINLPMSLALDKELTFKTIFRYRHIYPMAIDAVASGKVNLKGIVSNIFDFNDIQNAMDKSVADKANIVKSVVKIG